MSVNVDPSRYFSLNDKVVFGLSSDEEAEKYRCLVKKIKGRLIAVVVSNRDKGRLSLSIGDIIHFFHESGGEVWVTSAEVAQNQSYPLIILNTVSSRSLAEQEELSSMTGEVEPIADDHIAPESGAEEAGAGTEAEPGTGTSRYTDETPSGELTKPSAGGLSLDVEEISDEELLGDTERLLGLEGQEMNGAGRAQALDEIPEIDTSELEADLDAEVEASITREPSQVPGMDIPEETDLNEDEYAGAGLEDMEITRGSVVDMGEEYGDEPYKEAEEPTPVAEKDAGMAGAGQERAEAPETLPEAGRMFEDYFGFSFMVMDNDTAERVEALLLGGGAPEGQGTEPGEPESGSPGDPLRAFSERLSRVERALAGLVGGEAGRAQFLYGAALGGAAREPWRKAISVSLGPDMIFASLEEPVVDGTCVLVTVDRPWEPPLRFDAVAVCFECEERDNGVFTAKLRFVAIRPEDVEAIQKHLAEGQAHADRLREAAGR